MFSQKGSGYLASAVGVPLYMDKVTAKNQDLLLLGFVLK